MFIFAEDEAKKACVVAPCKPFEQGLKIGEKGRTFKKSPF